MRETKETKKKKKEEEEEDEGAKRVVFDVIGTVFSAEGLLRDR